MLFIRFFGNLFQKKVGICNGKKNLVILPCMSGGKKHKLTIGKNKKMCYNKFHIKKGGGIYETTGQGGREKNPLF